MTHDVRFPRRDVARVLMTTVRAFRSQIARYAFVGSFRRGLETCGDADLLVTPPGDRLLPIVRSFGSGVEGGKDFIYADVGGLPLNVFVCDPEEWGSSLQYTTGSMEHNIAVRTWAKTKGLIANQFGVFRRTGARTGRKIPGSSLTEGGFYAALELRWPRPEIRRRIGGRWSSKVGIIPLHGNREPDSPGNRKTGGAAKRPFGGPPNPPINAPSSPDDGWPECR